MTGLNSYDLCSYALAAAGSSEYEVLELTDALLSSRLSLDGIDDIGLMSAKSDHFPSGTACVDALVLETEVAVDPLAESSA